MTSDSTAATASTALRTRRYTSRYSTEHEQRNLWVVGFWPIRSWVAPTPLVSCSPNCLNSDYRSDDPNGFPSVLPKQQPPAPTVTHLALGTALFSRGVFRPERSFSAWRDSLLGKCRQEMAHLKESVLVLNPIIFNFSRLVIALIAASRLSARPRLGWISW